MHQLYEKYIMNVKFENFNLFKTLVKNSGFNLFLGVGFSVYAYNSDNESLPLGNEINNELIKIFGVTSGKKFLFK